MRLDFSSNDDYTLKIQNGDFVIENAELMQASIIINSSKGEVRLSPLLGVSISSYIGSSVDKTILYNVITEQLANDGLIVDSISAEVTDKEVIFDVKIK